MFSSSLFDSVLFPDPRTADPYGLVAIGGDYRPRTLLSAYASGIFPWPAEDLPYAWYSPDPRFVLPPAELHVGRSLKKSLRRHRYRITFDRAFGRVIRACSTIRRRGEPGTWIVPDLRRGFEALHRQGFAHSVEAWHGDELVGGLYGVALGGLFCGESMFARRNDASKAALVTLVDRLLEWDFRLIDCQVQTDHLESLGARDWPRQRFLDELAVALAMPHRVGSWSSPPTPPGDGVTIAP
ncbi:MAG: leucyl/phenylalanyl-tRNA--protein transferase [Acidobacteriota bacterium]